MDQKSVLAKYTRQPKIYIKLPSNGRFYKSNPLEKSGSGELPIYSMTASDEISVRTPDALMNGESTATIIKSCCPLINDPWDIPVIDLDAILIAIRIATYGEKMNIDVRVDIPDKTPEVVTTEIDLRPLLDSLLGKEFPTEFKHGELTFHLRPLNYKDQSVFFQSAYETQRLASMLGNENMTEEQKREAFMKGFKMLSKNTMDIVIRQVVAIETPEGVENDPKFINEFFLNTDKDTFTAVSEFLNQAKEIFDLKPQKVKVPENLVNQGASSEVTAPIMFDTSNFFVSK